MFEKIINKIPYVVKLLDRIEELEDTVYEQEAYISMYYSNFESLTSENANLKAIIGVHEETPVESKSLEEAEEVNVPTIKTYDQNSPTTVRYYYSSEYLFSAPKDYLEEIQLQLNRLLIKNPDLDLATIKRYLTYFKNEMLETGIRERSC